jgi:hypothetical protein
MSVPPPLPPSSSPALDAAPKACVNCGSIRFSTQTKLPVCEPCRVALIKYPFPLWVKVAAAIIAALVLVSLALSRERIQAAVHIAHAKKLMRQEHWEDAYQDYHSVIAEHTDTETLLSYAEAAMNSGHSLDAAGAMKSLAGRQATTDQCYRANSLIYRLDRPTGSFLPPGPNLQMTDIGSALQPDKPSLQLTSGQPTPMNMPPTAPPVSNVPAGQILLGQPMQLNNVPIQLQTR